MEDRTFFEHYRICTGEDESDQEVSRTGAAINYKAIDTRSHERVRLQLIPVGTIERTKLQQLKERAETAEKLDHVNIAKTFAVGVEHDYFALVSEYLEGETADSWIVANGPMATDAALRVGLQVVRPIGAAAFFNLTHRAIQPSNLIIVPGQSPDGGWPFVKLLNFGLAGLELHSDSSEAPELAPTILPQFASPEQRANGEVDFRSEMYSLGATMCFLLTGAAPLAVSGMKARLRIQRLPELRRAPKPLHNLLVYLLRENPENRPQDPVALEHEMRECLTKIEKRQAIGRKLGIPLATVVPRKTTEPRQPASPLAQVLGGVAAVAVLVLAAAAAGEYFFPDKIPFLRRGGKIGVPVGIPDAAAPTSNASAPPVTAKQPAESASPAIAATSENSPSVVQENQTANASGAAPVTSPAAPSTQIASVEQQSQPASPTAGATNATGAAPVTSPAAPSTQIASVGQQSQPASPAAGRSDQSSTADSSDQSSSTQSSQSNVRSKKKTTASKQRSTSRGARIERGFPYGDEYARGPIYQGRRHAQVIGRTADGRMIVRLSSGRVVILPPLNDDDIYAPRPRRRIFVERPDDGFVPPAQPFYPSDYPND